MTACLDQDIHRILAVGLWYPIGVLRARHKPAQTTADLLPLNDRQQAIRLDMFQRHPILFPDAMHDHTARVLRGAS
jgi:hypothetical protein